MALSRPNKTLQPTGPEAARFSSRSALIFCSPARPRASLTEQLLMQLSELLQRKRSHLAAISKHFSLEILELNFIPRGKHLLDLSVNELASSSILLVSPFG